MTENTVEGKPLGTKNNGRTDVPNASLETNITDQLDIQRSWHSLMESKCISDAEIFEYLSGESEEELNIKVQDIKDDNANMVKENVVYASALESEDRWNLLKTLEETKKLPMEKLMILSWPLKCYYAKKRLKVLVNTHDKEKFLIESNILELQFKLENLSRSLEDLKSAMMNFKRSVQTGGLHPVTKRVMLQKVAKFFDDSIKFKMTLTNRYKMQIQTNTMEYNKLFCQIKEQEKRLASLDLVKFQQTKFDFEKSCKSIVDHRDQLSKCKSKFSFLSQTVHEGKKNLGKEKGRFEQINLALERKKYVKGVLISEKARNEEKVKELDASMRKIRLDPRRHGLPEVYEYAKAKRENELLKQNIAMWKKKVAVVQQSKRMFLMSKRKK